jgi:hypothetical protein
MNMNVQLPEIDTETKQRVVNYFSKANELGQVLVTLHRDDLPDTVEKLEIVSFAPASGKKEDRIIDNEIIVVSLLTHKTGAVDMGVVIQTRVNQNSMGIPCGTKSENLMFNGKHAEWLLALKTI